ncbi:unnamed protein product, partial [Brassica rapa subsp. trilocularis]
RNVNINHLVDHRTEIDILLLHLQPHDAAQLSHEMTSPTSNGTLEVIESNKIESMPKFSWVMVRAETEWQGAGVVTAWQ